MRTLDPAVQAQAGSRQQHAVLLVQITGWGAGTVRWSGSGEEVEWPVGSGTVYDGRPLRLEGLTGAVTGQGLTLQVANHDLAVTRMLQADDPSGAVLTATRLWFDPATLAPQAAETLVDGAVIQGHVRADWVSLQCVPPSGARRQAPGRTFDRLCPWTFKDPDTCRYSGAETDCDHTDERCAQLGNLQNFGGFLLLLPREW